MAWRHSEAVAKQIQARIAELKSEIEVNERALEALRGHWARRRGRYGQLERGAAHPPGTLGAVAPKRPPRTRTVSAEAVFDALKDGQDQASAIAKRFGVSPAVVRNRLRNSNRPDGSAGRATGARPAGAATRAMPLPSTSDDVRRAYLIKVHKASVTFTRPAKGNGQVTGKLAGHEVKLFTIRPRGRSALSDRGRAAAR